jgi:hypothetical protein
MNTLNLYSDDDNLTKEDWKRMYWDQVNKRKESNIIVDRYNSNINLQNEDLKKRIDLLEQNYIDGTIIGLSNNFMTIRCKYGEISIHKSKLNNELLYGKNMYKSCKFKLIYHLNKYQGTSLIIE